MQQHEKIVAVASDGIYSQSMFASVPGLAESSSEAAEIAMSRGHQVRCSYLLLELYISMLDIG